MYLESSETTEKAMSLKTTGRNLLTSKLPGALSGWEVIGFIVEPAETITTYPLSVQITLSHAEYTDLGELEELIEDWQAITNWLETLGVSITEVDYDINANRYTALMTDDVPADDYTHSFVYVGDEI